MRLSSRIYVAGHRGLVGSAIVRNLKSRGYKNLLLKSHSELDLVDQSAVQEFFRQQKPEFVFLAAARAGGIVANNTAQADFLYENLMIASNVIRAAYESKVEKLLFLGSSCVYPKMASQPIREESLLSGPLESTNEGYAVAKIAGLKLCEMFYRQYGCRFVSAMPTNIYGPYDNFHPELSHVIPGMMRRYHEAKENALSTLANWGTGAVRREFLHVDDLAEALHLLMECYESPQTINVGTGQDLTIRELANIMGEVIGFKGRVEFDSSRPDGTPQKVLDVSRIRDLGWVAQTNLKEGLASTYSWALENKAFSLRG